MPGGFYHVTLRGNHRAPIFFHDQDRENLNLIVAEALEKSGARLHAYCWMTNHLHFLVQLADVPLGRLVLQIAARYARRTQSALQTTGHLFERRYHGVLVDSDAYLLTLLRYIHLNPVRAGLVLDPLQHAWSSHRDYLGMRCQDWVTTGFGLRMLGRTRTAALSRYRELMTCTEELRWGFGALQTHPENSQILGDDAFLARATGLCVSRRPRTSFEALVEECGRRYGVTERDLASARRDRRLSTARAWLCYEALSGKVDTIRGIARRLQRSDTAIRRLLERRKPEPT